MARLRRTPEQARRHLLESARAILVADGPEKLTLSAVAKHADVSVALVAHYFGNRRQLVDDTIQSQLKAFAGSVLGALPSSASATARDITESFFEQLCTRENARLGAWLVLRDEDAVLSEERVALTRSFIGAVAQRTGLPVERVQKLYSLIYCAGFGFGLIERPLAVSLGVDPATHRAQFGELLAQVAETLSA